MSDESPAPEGAGSFRLTTKGDASWVAPIPWVLEVPLAFVLVYAVWTGPLEATHLVPAAGVIVAMAVLALPGLIQFTPDVRAWAHRTATIGDDGITVEMAGREPHFYPWSGLGRVLTRPLSLGMQIPPTTRLVSDFFDGDGMRIPELTVHHSSYRSIVRSADVNDDGPAFLGALVYTPAGEGFDLATRTFLDLVNGGDDGVRDGLSEKSVEEMRAGRLWHARRAVDDDKRTVDRVPDALIRINYVLRKESQRTAREALLERPGDPTVRYYLAHSILADARAAARLTDPKAVARRRRLRAEGHEMLEDLRSDPLWGRQAEADIREMESRAIMRDEEEAAVAAPALEPIVVRQRVPRPEVPKPPVPMRPGKKVEPPPRPEHDKPRVFDRESLEKHARKRWGRR